MNSVEKEKYQYRLLLWESLYNWLTGITTNQVLVCEDIKLAVDRFYSDLLNETEYYINNEELDKLFNFLYYVNIDNYYGQFVRFVPEPWQIFYFINIYGFYLKKEPNARRFNRSFLTISRKNGKSTLAAIQLLYSMTKEGNNNRIYSVSESKNMTVDSLMYICKKIINNSPALGKRIEQLQYTLKYKNNVYKMLPNKPDALNAIRPSGIGIVDELHTMKDSTIVDKLTSGAGSSFNFLLSIIGTRGSNSTYYQYDLEQTYKRVLRNEIEDPRTFIMMFGMDTEDEANNPDMWVKSNPNIGTSLSKEYMIDTFNKAKLTPTSLKEFFVFNLNMWLESKEDQFIEQEFINQAFEKGEKLGLNLEFFRGKDVYLGLDMSATGDLSSLIVLHYDKDEHQFYVHPFIYFANNPNKRVRGRGIDLTQWIMEDDIYQCEEKRIDYNKVIQDIVYINSICNIKDLGSDGWNKSEIEPVLEQQNIYTTTVSQSIKDMSQTTKFLDRIFAQGEITCTNNKAFKWQFKNCVIYTDANNNIKLNKNTSRDSIDSVVALQNALELWRRENEEELYNVGYSPIKLEIR